MIIFQSKSSTDVIAALAKSPGSPSAPPSSVECGICGRLFGQKSIKIHEPQCLKKWQQQNELLPLGKKQKLPSKLETLSTSVIEQESIPEINAREKKSSNKKPNPAQVFEFQDNTPSLARIQKLAAKIKPKENQSFIRKRYPTCSFESQEKVPVLVIEQKSAALEIRAKRKRKPNSVMKPNPTKVFESQEKVPPLVLEQKSAPEIKLTERPSSVKKPNMLPCYLCGRLFGITSIYIHEPQCLKKWRIENEKLSPNKRRPEPLKPDIKFTPDGKIDYDSMNETTWQSHLSQLVPCNVCGRTFSPDRVDIHERSCKG